MRRTTAIVLSTLLLWANIGPVWAQSAEQPKLETLVEKSYLELLELSPRLSFTEEEIRAFRKRLESEKRAEEKRLEREERQLQQAIKRARKQLAELNRRADRESEPVATERRQLHCRILKLERQLRLKRVERQQGVKVAFANKFAKLDLIAQWPAKKKEIERIIAEGRARERRHGDVEDIGIRLVGEGQEKDIKIGEEAIRRMKAYGLMPPEVEDEKLNAYVRNLAEVIAANSDLRVPVRVTVLESDEINAFALPGGFLFVNTGLLQKVETESELAGVMAHEIAHAAARHGARMMKRATIANLVYQAAQIAALIFTGGVVGVGTYYALQYGFFGLGMVLELALLGVSREFEAEADQLGVQYCWKAGYDPKGFITFFDEMASEKGYVKAVSFFRTHPPFYDRIVATFSEIMYLPPKPDLIVDSPQFHRAKRRLKQVLREIKLKEREKPTLKRLPQCDEDETKEDQSTGEEGASRSDRVARARRISPLSRATESL